MGIFRGRSPLHYAAMAERSVDELRAELRRLGYLTHGIERWFALDPWSSRTFWAELLAVSAKAALLVAFFAALPPAAIMAMRNQPVPLPGVGILFGIYFGGAVVSIFLLVIALALILKSRPTIAIDSPAALTAMSLGLAFLIAGGILGWWSGFESGPPMVEVAVGSALVILLIVVAVVVFSAALLSFSIHEARRIPLVARRDRTVPLAIAALVVATAIGLWAMRSTGSVRAAAPAQVVVAPTTARVALLAVDGMTWDLFAAKRPEAPRFAFATPVTPYTGTRSSAERWASLGTGTRTEAHAVRAIDGIRLAGSDEVLQSTSPWDFAIDRLAVPAGLARRVPLPPTMRRRHYAWEIMSARGVRAAAVNWWVTEDTESPDLVSVSQSTIFAEASRSSGTPSELALAIDRLALERLEKAVAATSPRFATAYLPASDIVLNRIELDASARAAASIRAAEDVFAAALRLSEAGYEVVVVGMPGEGSEANAVLASTMEAASPPTLDAVAPTLLALMGFPATSEMSASVFFPAPKTSPIPTYGDRDADPGRTATSDEYYESLKSLGYIR